MAGEALFLGWGPVIRGREQKSLQVFQETVEYYGKLQQEGKIESFEPVLVAPHGGDLGGFVLLRGERGRLDEVRSSEEFERLVTRAAMLSARRWAGSRPPRRSSRDSLPASEPALTWAAPQFPRRHAIGGYVDVREPV
jgi:hypothetical protein